VPGYVDRMPDRGSRNDLDAMGQDKRRQVVGHAYGPSRKSQIAFFAIVVAVLVVAIGGYALAVAAFDQPKDDYPDSAPWAESGAEQRTTRDPSGPCGEPGNAYPPPDDSPCSRGGIDAEAKGEKADDGRSGAVAVE